MNLNMIDDKMKIKIKRSTSIKNKDLRQQKVFAMWDKPINTNRESLKKKLMVSK